MKRNKKARLALMDDIIVYIFFIVIVVGFLLWASVLGARFDDNQNAITSEFNSLEVDAVLLGLMRTSAIEDLDGNGQVDARTIADLISLSATEDVLREHVEKTLFNVCNEDGELRCSWKLQIGEEMSFESDNRPSLTERFLGKKDSVSVIYVPLKNEDREVVKVEYHQTES